MALEARVAWLESLPGNRPKTLLTESNFVSSSVTPQIPTPSNANVMKKTAICKRKKKLVKEKKSSFKLELTHFKIFADLIFIFQSCAIVHSSYHRKIFR